MKKIGLFLILSIIVLSACSKDDTGEKPNQSATKVTAEQAAKMIKSDQGIVILDVRTEEAFEEEGYIADAILLPDTEIKNKAAAVLPNKKATILVYDTEGIKSATAAQALVDMGYTKVYDMGGLTDWEGAVKVSTNQAYQLKNSDDNVVILDVRTAVKYEEEHIKGAILIPNQEIRMQAETILPNKNAIILAYCDGSNCALAPSAVRKLSRMGYTNAYHFDGIEDWPGKVEGSSK